MTEEKRITVGTVRADLEKFDDGDPIMFGANYNDEGIPTEVGFGILRGDQIYFLVCSPLPEIIDPRHN